jgi:hypothetical protein
MTRFLFLVDSPQLQPYVGLRLLNGPHTIFSTFRPLFKISDLALSSITIHTVPPSGFIAPSIFRKTFRSVTRFSGMKHARPTSACGI